MIRSAVLTAAVGGVFALAACGNDDEEATSAEPKTTPQQALVEIAAVREAIDKAADQVRSGDKAAADETVSEAYLQHFEKVEGPLEERDHELNEELEEAISMELREKIKTGSTADVQNLAAEIDHHLTAAEGKLK